MKLSILDQAPISEGQSAKEALEASCQLAQVGDEYGFNRFWVAEHHALPSLASSTPEVFLGYVGAQTKRIRIGSGATLLPYYKPYKVAENFNMLATLFEGRVDLGIGRAPGGPSEASEALTDAFLPQVFKMPELVDELIQYNENITGLPPANPLPGTPPALWMLGTSPKSAGFAAENGLSYCFGQFMSDEDGAEVVKQYRKKFQPRGGQDRPHAMLGISVVCADTSEEAHDIADSWAVWQLMQSEGTTAKVPSSETAHIYMETAEVPKKVEAAKQKMIIGDPADVVDELERLQNTTGVDEFMIITITHSPEDKWKSYQLISEQAANR
ncbi:LLM class flavin-dependent oxidoreductase [Salinicoccus siamensis]|uniref:LLM class flavin-dependent oxidoreductase n=1 Tax=Salinicoccus siamensis TaxID=381830 RepID=A0ABV5Z3I3_9STAP